jgi:hypothetical protein
VRALGTAANLPALPASRRRPLRQSERFTLPSGQEVEAEARAPPDLEVVRRRLKETVGVLDNFAALRQPGRSRAEYMDQVGGGGGAWSFGGSEGCRAAQGDI